MSFVPLVTVVILFWLGVFYVIFAAQGLSAADFVLGRKTPLPEHLGEWRQAGIDAAGRVKQERRIKPGGQADPSFLILQVRFVDPHTGDILDVLPEQREPRRRRRV